MKISLSIFFALFLLLSCKEQGKDEQQKPEAPEPGEPVAEVDWDEATLAWSDEFDGEAVDTEKWKFETGANGWGNNEWQNYTSGPNSSVSDGLLKITAKKVGAGQKVGDYTSSRMLSKETFTYGRMEVRAKIPEWKGKGVWPAIWMLGDNISQVGWPDCGEIDIMEYVSYAPNEVHFSIHSKANNHVQGTQITTGPMKLETIEEEFHNYGILWTERYVKFYLDDIDNVKLTFNKPTVPSQDNWPFDKPFFFLLNIAVGGNWGGLQGVDDNIFPSTMEVDYVRVYQFE
ncbi:MAG: glycoside hydrolase family 16 protein [Imperialibacter sp.]|uniref:glycoside hydrolase family 16 protein n=1 Tax=Imperialibacter sp. TaxID=2038411 RepID=UPI0030D88556|tara:strand:- start:299112 stop:299972 length:861 start_codon:yes stop_codon:yes gene_type:complete